MGSFLQVKRTAQSYAVAFKLSKIAMVNRLITMVELAWLKIKAIKRLASMTAGTQTSGALRAISVTTLMTI